MAVMHPPSPARGPHRETRRPIAEPTTDARTAIAELLDSRIVAYRPAFAAIAGGVTAGLLLSQLCYWHDKGADPDRRICRTRDQWRQETGLTRGQQETARRRPRQRGIIEEKLAGIPARVHYRLDVDAVITLLAERRQASLPETARQD